MYMHVHAARAKTGAQLVSRYTQVPMTECSKYICIWTFFFDLYRIITSLLQPHFHSPSPPPPAPCCMHTLGSFLNPPTPSTHPLPDFIRALYPFQPSREKSECKSPICTHYTERVLGMRKTGEKAEREDVRKSRKNARSWSGQLKVFVWYWILALGNIFRKMPLLEMCICSDCLSFSQLNICASASIVWSITILKEGKISRDQVEFHS